ncbi:hypothetical protein JCM13580A_63490 [Streptomyces drozdowiczii]
MSPGDPGVRREQAALEHQPVTTYGYGIAPASSPSTDAALPTSHRMGSRLDTSVQALAGPAGATLGMLRPIRKSQGSEYTASATKRRSGLSRDFRKGMRLRDSPPYSPYRHAARRARRTSPLGGRTLPGP